MPFAIKRAMHVHRGIVIGIGFIVTDGTAKQLSPFLDDALAASIREPLPFGAASGAILRSPMRIDLDRDNLMEVGFVLGVLIDLAAQLVRTSAVHAPRFAARTGFDRAQALKEQDTAWIPGADVGNATCHLVGGIVVESIDMLPELLVTVLALDWFARLPLFLGNAFEMAVAVGIQAMIGHKHRLDDPAMLSHCNYGEVFDI